MCICMHDMHCICLFCLAKSKFGFKLLFIIEEVHAINTNGLNKLSASGLEFKNTNLRFYVAVAFKYVRDIKAVMESE